MACSNLTGVPLTPPIADHLRGRHIQEAVEGLAAGRPCQSSPQWHCVITDRGQSGARLS